MDLVVDAQTQVPSGSRRLLQMLARTEQLREGPRTVSDPRCHRRRSALQGLVRSAEIVVSKVERQGRFQVFPLLAEPVRQASQPPHAHAHREVLPLDMRCADLLLIWISIDRRWNRLSQVRRAIAPRVLGNVKRVDFHQLRVVNKSALVAEGNSDGIGVGSQPVGCELEFLIAIRGARQLAHEPLARFDVALPELVREHQLCIALNRDERPGITNEFGLRLAAVLVRSLLENESPNFIALHVRHGNVANEHWEHSLTVIASGDEHLQDRSMVQSCDARRSANAGAFAYESDCQLARVRSKTAESGGYIFVRFGIGFCALIAAKALQSVAVFAKALTINTAVVARHSDLELSSGRSHNGRGLRNPALDFGLRLNSAGSSNYLRSELWFGRALNGFGCAHKLIDVTLFSSPHFL